MSPPSEACPCLHIEPCGPRCTCAQPLSSVGCRRCCSYGSPEQQVDKAKHLADLDQYPTILIRDLGLSPTASAEEVRDRLKELWEVTGMALTLVRWWDHPEIHHGIQHPLVASCEERLRERLRKLYRAEDL